MIQITPQMRVLVAVEPADFRRGIDGLARLCRERLCADPFSGCLFVFRNRRATAVKILVYDGQGFWLCQKRLSAGKFRWWPTRTADGVRIPRMPTTDSGHVDQGSERSDAGGWNHMLKWSTWVKGEWVFLLDSPVRASR